jgi:hypothetical protein
VRRLLVAHKHDLDVVVTALLREETISQDELGRMLGPRSEPIAEAVPQA